MYYIIIITMLCSFKYYVLDYVMFCYVLLCCVRLFGADVFLLN